MSDYRPPCQKGDPDDWFISKDGKQYADDKLISNVGSFLADAHANYDDRPDEEILAEAEAEAVKDALVRRRHAKDACHVECYLRTHCLGIALEHDITAGTWGGYYEEELKEIRKLRDAHKR